MIAHELLHEEGILIISPQGRLESADFTRLAEEVDPYIREKGKLAGLIIYVEAFPGWEDLGALLSHLKFVKDHHKHIAKVAAVTDSKFLSIMPRVAQHFVSAEVKHFDYRNKEAALEWLRQ